MRENKIVKKWSKTRENWALKNGETQKTFVREKNRVIFGPDIPSQKIQKATPWNSTKMASQS